jgi:hypothetical protein
MSEPSNKNIFGKFINLLSGRPEDEDKNPSKSASKAELKGAYSPNKKEPVDLSFVKNFTRSEGKFLYCENEDEVYQNLQLIIQESGLNKIYCQNPVLITLLRNAGLQVVSTLKNADAFCSPCEYLVAFNGGIMLTAKQTQERKLTELPNTFITVAYTNQITANLRSALAGIRNKYHGDLPSQITTIKGPKMLDEIEDMPDASVCKKEIYLLLLEEQS